MKKTMVRSGDYELYKILLPWKYLLSRHRNFILGELEKMHPRFSGNCCYDTKYSLRKKNIFAEVVVMERANLARYKNAGGELFLESEQKRSVFSGRAKIVHAASVALIVLAGILSLRIAKSLLTASDGRTQNILAVETAPVSESLSQNQVAEENLSAAKSSEMLLREVFSSVSRRGGKISAFSYERDVFPAKNTVSGECKFSIYGCNSEDVANARYCVVSFQNNEPHFELLLPFEENLSLADETGVEDFLTAGRTALNLFSYEDEMLSVAQVRKSLRDLGAVIEREHNGDESAEFSFVTDSSLLYSCLKICGENAEKLKWNAKNFAVMEIGGKCRVSCSFSKENSGISFSPILLCAQNAYLFGSELKVVPKTQKLFAPKPSQMKSLVAKNKLGEVRRADGAVFICYRNADGRIKYAKKEIVNE